MANFGSDTVTPIDTATGAPGRPIPVGQAPDAIAITPGGRTVYVINGDNDTVTPIATAIGQPGPPIPVGYSPASVTISRSGGTAYVVNTISGTVTPVSTATGTGPVTRSRSGCTTIRSPSTRSRPAGDGPGARHLRGPGHPGRAPPPGTCSAAITVGNFPVAAVITPP